MQKFVHFGDLVCIIKVRLGQRFYIYIKKKMGFFFQSLEIVNNVVNA